MHQECRMHPQSIEITHWRSFQDIKSHFAATEIVNLAMLL